MYLGDGRIVVHRNAEFKTVDVIRFRGKVAEPELKVVLMELDNYIKLNGAGKTGGLITAMRLLNLTTRVSDIEIFLPINKEIPSTKDITHLPYFALNNCISARYNGISCLIPNAYAKFYHQAKNMGIDVKQPFYNVFTKEDDCIWSLNEIEMDIYAVVEDFTC